jgi:8-oxo-dGTP diphosphatase
MKHLPHLYLITPEPCNKFLYKLESCLEQGIRLVQLRAKTISESKYYAYAEQSLKLCENYNAQLLVNTSLEMALSIGAHGVHLNSTRLYSYNSLKIELAAASCHNLADIQQANKIGLNFIVLSAVKPTASHPNAKTLGWNKFADLTKQSNCPVFALGGMTREDLTIAHKYGAHGIAAIRALWKNSTVSKPHKE